MAEPTFTAEQVYAAVLAVLDQRPVSLWLETPQDTTTPSGSLHPEDAGHVARWTVERLTGEGFPVAELDLTALGRVRLRLCKPEHLAAIANEEPTALVRRLRTTGAVAELLRWFAENAAELLEVSDR